MPNKSDKNVGILIELLIDAEQFVTEVQKSLKTGKNLVQRSADEMKAALDKVFRISGIDTGLTRTFQQLADTLKKSTRSFDEVAKELKEKNVPNEAIAKLKTVVSGGTITIADAAKLLKGIKEEI